jgi:archaellum component FlaC
MVRHLCRFLVAALAVIGSAHREEYVDFDLDDRAGLAQELLARAGSVKRHFPAVQAALIQQVTLAPTSPPADPTPPPTPRNEAPPSGTEAPPSPRTEAPPSPRTEARNEAPTTPLPGGSSASPPTLIAPVISPSQQAPLPVQPVVRDAPPVIPVNRDPCAKGTPVDLNREAPGCDEAREQKKTLSWWSKSHHQKFITQLIDMCDRYDKNRKSVAKTYETRTKETTKLEEKIEKLDRELKDLDHKLNQVNRQLRVKMDNLCSENERLQKANELRQKAIEAAPLKK